MAATKTTPERGWERSLAMLASCHRLGFTPSRAAYVARSNRRELAPVACQVRAGNRTFEDAAELKREVRLLLHKYPVATVFNPEEGELLLDVLKMHPRWERKVGVGVKHFTSDMTEYLPQTRFFVVVRLDDSREDFSYLKCLQIMDSQHRGLEPRARPVRRTDSTGSPVRYFDKEIDGALMRAVRMQAQFFKQQALKQTGVRCPVYPRLALNEDNCRPQYAQPQTFQSLKADWMASEGLSSADLLLTAGNKQKPQELADRRMLESWRSYHQEHARYVLMSWVAINSAAVFERSGQQGGGDGGPGRRGR